MRKGKARRSGAGAMSCTRSRIKPWQLLAQSSINSSKPQEPPQPIQAPCNSRDSSPSHQFGSPKLDTHKTQINLEKAVCSAKNWSNFPSQGHSLYVMCGGTPSSRTQGPSRVTLTWEHPTPLRTAPGASSALLRVHMVPVSCPQPCAPAQQSRGATDGLDEPAGGGDLPGQQSREHRAQGQSARVCLKLNCKPFFQVWTPWASVHSSSPSFKWKSRKSAQGFNTNQHMKLHHVISRNILLLGCAAPAMCSMVPKEILHFY